MGHALRRAVLDMRIMKITQNHLKTRIVHSIICTIVK
jgi:hypothetical protein